MGFTLFKLVLTSNTNHSSMGVGFVTIKHQPQFNGCWFCHNQTPTTVQWVLVLSQSNTNHSSMGVGFVIIKHQPQFNGCWFCHNQTSTTVQWVLVLSQSDEIRSFTKTTGAWFDPSVTRPGKEASTYRGAG